MIASQRTFSLLALVFFATSFPQLGCKKEVKEDETSEKEEKSEKKKKKSSDDEESTDDDSKSKKKKKAESDEEESDEPKKLSKLGIKSCDKYLDKMQECADKANPKAARQGILDAAKNVHKSWKEAAESSPAAKAGLETGCKTALKGAATAYKSTCKGVFDEEEE